MHTAVAGDDNDLSVSLLSSGWYTLRTHLRHATQVEKSSRGSLRPIYCLAAPRAREARRRGGVRDGARRRQNRLTRRRRGIARRRGAARCSGAKACVAALASDAHLIPERPAWLPSAAAELRMAWEELPHRNRWWRVLKNLALKPDVLSIDKLVDIGSGTYAWRCRRRRATPGDWR